MSRELRKKPRINYADFQEPSPDEYVFCAECGDYVHENCTIHGPLLVLPDDKMYDRHGRPAHVIDAADARRSNWMRYVNCSRHWCEQNLISFQYRGQLYYSTIKIIPPFTELMVFYGAEFAQELGVDLRTYDAPSGLYAQEYGAPAKKSAKATYKKALTGVAQKLNQTETVDCAANKKKRQKREEKTEEPKEKSD